MIRMIFWDQYPSFNYPEIKINLLPETINLFISGISDKPSKL